MPTPGYVFRDGGTTPPNEAAGSTALEARPGALPVNGRTQAVPQSQPGAVPVDVRPQTVKQSPIAQNTSESHALATENHELQGAAQQAGKETRTTNLGWQANAEGVATLVGGIPNEELWTLVRRFNKVRFTSTFEKIGS